MVDFVLGSESPQPPLERGAKKVPLFKGDLGGFRPFSIVLRLVCVPQIEGTHKGHPYRNILCAGVILFILLAPQVSAEPMKSIESSRSESSQLANAQPPDWAVKDLQSVMKRAGVSRPLTPKSGGTGVGSPPDLGDLGGAWEQFTTDLNAVKSRSNRLSQADLTTLQRLETEFRTELAAMRKRVAQLESIGADLESQQFSTTTKLRGQVIMAINAGGFSGTRIIAPRGAVVTSDRPNPTSLYRVSLDLDTSFNGKDLLKARLVAGSDGIADNAGGRLEPNLGSTLDFSIPGRNQVSLGRLYYAFSPQPDLRVTIGSVLAAPDFVDKNRYANASFLDFSTQALVTNFILFPRAVGAGAAAEWKASKDFNLRGVYIAGDATNRIPENQQVVGGGGANDIRLFPAGGGGADGGLFGDPYQGIVELEYAPTKAFAARLQYGGGRVFGSNFNVVGINTELALSDRIGIFGRYGSGSYPNTTLGDIRPQYWMAGISFSDVFIPKAIAGIAVGQPFVEGRIGNATQTNIEAFYNVPINDRLRITPIFQVITNPANQNTNGTIFSGTLRTVFSF
jgi:Carbohydrate-selective porin, OprB family